MRVLVAAPILSRPAPACWCPVRRSDQSAVKFAGVAGRFDSSGCPRGAGRDKRPREDFCRFRTESRSAANQTRLTIPLGSLARKRVSGFRMMAVRATRGVGRRATELQLSFSGHCRGSVGNRCFFFGLGGQVARGHHIGVPVPFPRAALFHVLQYSTCCSFANPNDKDFFSGTY